MSGPAAPTSSEGWGHRFATYAASHGRTPAEQVAADRVRWRGGAMAGYMIWLDERWREFGIPIGSRHVTDAEHAAFDAWLMAGEVAA